MLTHVISLLLYTLWLFDACVERQYVCQNYLSDLQVSRCCRVLERFRTVPHCFGCAEIKLEWCAKETEDMQSFHMGAVVEMSSIMLLCSFVC